MASIEDHPTVLEPQTPESTTNSSLESYLPSDLDLDDFSDNEQQIQKAMAYLKFYEMKKDHVTPSVRSVTEKFGVPRTTFRERMHGVQPKATSNAAKSHFSASETEVLISLITVSAERGFPLTIKSLCDTANYILLAKHKGVIDFTALSSPNNIFDELGDAENAPRVGKNWAKRWIKKHDDRIKRYRARKLDSQRARAVNPENIGHWFSLVRSIYVREGDKEDGEVEGTMTPDRIYGMDETCGWFDNAGRSMVLGGKGKKNQYLTRKSSRESATLIVSSCADGSVLKPFCIFSARKMHKEWKKINPLEAR